MNESMLSDLGNYGVLGAIAGVAIWGVVRGISALWTSLQDREKQLFEMHQEFSERLENINAHVSDIVRVSTEELALLRSSMTEFMEDSRELNLRLANILKLLEESIQRDQQRPACPSIDSIS